MNQFYKSAMRILLLMAFLLAVAWVSMKLMQGGLDLEDLLIEGQKRLDGLGDKLGQLDRRVIQPLRQFLGPKLDELARWVRGIIQH